MKTINCFVYMGFGFKNPLPHHIKVLHKLIILHGLWLQAALSLINLDFLTSFYSYMGFGGQAPPHHIEVLHKLVFLHGPWLQAPPLTLLDSLAD